MHRLAAAVLLSLPLAAQAPAVNPEPELGQVVWQRAFDLAQQTAKDTGRPLFLLFQEIPGCATCTGFGKEVLGHPLLVTAIQDCFVPVVVRNNVDGAEGEVRERFAEPAWNNPVVRLLDGTGKDLVPRRDGVFDVHGIAARMVDALRAAKRPVPGCLLVARDESDPAVERAVFEMHCFWEGEAVLGALDGVVRTRSAFVDGKEVVEVTFRPSVLTRAQLTEAAQAKSCQPVATDRTPKAAPASDQQHALGGTPYAKLDLSPMQRTKVHAALTLGTDPKVWLTPAQVAAMQPEQH